MDRRHWIAVVWTGLMLTATLLPRGWAPEGLERPSPRFHIPHRDKIAHLVLFAGFGFLWARAESSRRLDAPIVVGGLALALLTELAQALPLISRSPDALDFAADAAGLVAGLAAFRLLGTPPRRPDLEPALSGDDPSESSLRNSSS